MFQRRTIAFAKSNFRNGGDSLRGIEANRQVCPTISEITFGKCSNSSRFSAIPMEHLGRFICAFPMIVLLLGIATSQADVSLPKIIGDHMVLQRGMKTPIWGRAEPGEKVNVQGDWQRKPVAVVRSEE